MGLGGILQELKTEGVLALYHDYRSGTLRDWSGNGNHASITGVGPFFDKVGVDLPNGQYLTVPFSASWAWTTSVSVVFGHFVTNTMFNALIGWDLLRHDAAQGFLVRAGDAYLGWSDFINLRSVAISSNLYRSLGLSMSNGATGASYVNGTAAGALSGNTVIGAPTGTLQIYKPATAGADFPIVGRYIVIVKRVLTATEHARVYGQLENMRWNTKGMAPGPMLPGW